MTNRIAKGIELLSEVEGSGAPATRGSRVDYSARIYLRRGDEVTADAEIIARGGAQLRIRRIDGTELIVHQAELGKRRLIAGIEKSLHGMKRGGYREVLIAPHLAYGERGVPGRVPANAMLRIRLWVDDVRPAT